MRLSQLLLGLLSQRVLSEVLAVMPLRVRRDYDFGDPPLQQFTNPDGLTFKEEVLNL